MGNDIGSGLAISVVYVCETDLGNNFSSIPFLYFNLNQKATELNNACHILVTTYNLFFGIVFYTYKNLHIEPFNYAMKSVCFDFCPTNAM
jgi:hypothetical protein